MEAIDTRGMDRAQWLNARRRGIGGSDAAAILGVSPYKSAYAVWADKMGYKDDADSEGMRQGRDLEDYVAQRFMAETGKKVVRHNRMIIRPGYPYMLANIDRRVLGEKAGLECKTSRDLHLKRYKNGEYPIEYYCQCQHYLAVTGWDIWYLAVLVFGTEFMVFEIPRDEEDIKELTGAEGAFWHDFVETGIQPPTDGLEATGKALGRVFSHSDGETLEWAEDGALAEYAALKAEEKALNMKINAAANKIKSAMGQAGKLTAPSYSAVWREQTRGGFNWEAFRADYPHLDLEPYKTQSVSRVFRVFGGDRA